MTRPALLAIVACAVALALAPGSPVAQSKGLDDLMMDLNIAPLDPRTAPHFAVTTLDGRRMTLADVKGQAALVYFWATW